MPRKREKWGIKCLVLLRARRKWHDWQSTQNEWVERGASGRRHIHEFNFIIVQYCTLVCTEYSILVQSYECPVSPTYVVFTGIHTCVRCIFYGRTSTVYSVHYTCTSTCARTHIRLMYWKFHSPYPIQN